MEHERFVRGRAMQINGRAERRYLNQDGSDDESQDERSKHEFTLRGNLPNESFPSGMPPYTREGFADETHDDTTKNGAAGARRRRTVRFRALPARIRTS